MNPERNGERPDEGAGSGVLVLRATVLLGVATLALALLGFLKNVVAAYFFGTSRAMDSYLLALVIPDAAAYMAITGVFNFVPLVAEARASGGEDEAKTVGGKLLTFWLVVLTGALVFCLLAAPLLSPIVAPGLSESVRPTHIANTRTLSLMALAVGAARVLTAVYTARKRFLLPSIGELAFQVGSIGYLLVCHDWGIPALTWGMVFGGAVQLLIAALGLRGLGIRIPMSFDPRHPAVRTMLRLTGPVYIGNAGGQLNSMTLVAFASTLAAGAVSALQYAYMIADAASNLLGASVSKAVFPFISQDAAEGRRDRIARGIERGLFAVASVALPSAIGLLVLAEPLVLLLFQRGSFDARSTHLTVVALRLYAIGVFAMTVNQLVSSTFYAHADTKTPMRLGLVRVAVTIATCAVLVRPFGHAGIALATALGENVKLVLMLRALRPLGLGLAVAGALRSSSRLLLASGIMAVAVLGIQAAWAAAGFDGPSQRILAVLIPATAGAVAYVASVRIMAPGDFSYFRELAGRVLPGRGERRAEGDR